MAITLTEIEAILSLKDEMSGKLAEINDRLGVLGEHAEKTGGHVSGLGGMMTLATTAGNLLSSGIQAVGGAAVGAVKDAFSLNSTLETARLSFETLTGSSEKAGTIVADLFEFAAKTPFRTDQVIEASRTLQVFGGEALNTKERLTLVGDAAAATGAPINEVSFWVGRMYAAMAANKPIGEAIQNLMQLGIVGPEASNALVSVAASGKTVEEKFAVMEQNLGKFTGAMEKQAASWTGVTSTFADTFSLMMAQAFEGTFEVVRDTLGNINTVLADADVQEAFAGIGQAIVGALGTDTQSQVISLTKILIGFFEGSLIGIEGAYRGWNLLKAGVLGTIEVIVTAIARAAEVNAKMAEMAAALPLVGDQYKQSAIDARAYATQLSGMAESFTQQRQEAANAATGQTAFTDALGRARTALHEAGAKIVETAEGQKRLAEQGIIAGGSMADLEKSTKGVGGAMPVVSEEAKKLGESIGKIAGDDKLAAASLMAQAIEKYGLESVIASQGVEKVHKTFDAAIDVMDARGKTAPQTWVDTAMATIEAEKSLNTYVEGLPKLQQQFEKVDPSKFFKDLAAATNAELPKVLEGLPGFLADAAAQVGDGATNVVAPSFAQSFKAGALGAKGLAGFGQDLGGVIMQAFTGGGNVGEAIGGLLGQTVGTGLNSAFQNMFNAGGPLASLAGSGLGSVLSGAMSAVLPGVGALLGSGLSAIMDTVFKGEEKRVNNMRDDFIASAGGLTALNEEAAKAGVTLDKLLDAKKTKDFEAAQKELTKAIEAHKEALAALDKDLTETFTKGMTLTDDLAKNMLTLFQRDPEAAGESIFKFLQGEVTNLTTGFNEAAQAWETTLTGGAAGFQRFATIGVAAFNAATEAGLSVPEALAAITPGLDALINGAQELGSGGSGNAAFDQLLSIAQLSSEFAPLLEQISGLSQMVTSLGNVGLLTQETFTALADQVGVTFQAMIDQGANADDAMRLIQPQLQKLWEAENQFGVATEGATATLLDQAFQAGIVGTQFSSAQDRMIESVNRLVSRMSDLITVMTGGTVSSLAGGAQWAAGQMTSAFTGSFNTLGPSAQAAAGAVNTQLATITAMDARSSVYKLENHFTDALPVVARIGAEAVNTQLATITAMDARRNVWMLEEHFTGALPNSARAGVSAVNSALDSVDVEGVQDAVHDIDWEFEQGIPDAAESGVGLVNQAMDVAEGAVETVRDASADVSDAMRYDIPESAVVAGDSIADLAYEAVGHFNDIEEAATAAAWGHSPTGIKEIAVAVDKTLPALRLLAQQGVMTFGTIERIAAAAAGTASEELMAVPESASQALWELYAAYDDAIGQMAAIAPEMTWGFQSIADRISDMANEAQSRWDQDWLTPPAPAVSSQDAEYLAEEQAMRERYGEAGLPTEQTIIIQLDGQVLAEQVIEHAPDLIEVFAG